MRLKFFTWFIGLGVLFNLCACSGSENTVCQGEIECTDIHVNVFSENWLTPSQVKKSHIVKLETTDNCLIGEVRKIKVTEDRIFVLDSDVSKSLFVFSKNGDFLLKIGQTGQGPGEYYSINDFFIDEKSKTISIYDADLRNIHYYDWEGTYNRKHSLSSFWLFACHPVGPDLYALDYNKKGLKNKYHLTLVDQNNKPYYQYKKLKMNHQLPGNFHIAFYEGVDSHLFYTPTRCDTIFNISSQGIVDGYSVDFGKQKMPENFLKGTNKEAQVKKLINSEYCYNITDVLETDRILFFNYAYKGMQWALFYDKDTKSSYAGLTYYPTPEATDNNYMVGIYESPLILSIMKEKGNEEHINKWKTIIGDDNWHFMEDFNEADNPLIVFYEIALNPLDK